MLKLAMPITALLVMTTTAFGQGQGPGHHFISNWDTDGNGAVSLEEATTRRGDVFTTFDADEDGTLSAAEYDSFDQARASHQAEMGQGQGQGQGKGHGKGMGEEQGMERAFNDANGDGLVSREEFMARVSDWFALMDSNGDGSVTSDDFGPGN